MISKRILLTIIAAIVLAPFAATTAEAKESTKRRPAHIDRIAWRNSISEAAFSNNDRPASRSRFITRSWHPKQSGRRFRAFNCPWKK